MPQFAFEWAARASYAPEDLIISDSNAEAARFLEIWPDDHHAQSALLSGERSSGKTHLAHRWLARAGGVMLDKSMLGRKESEEIWGKATHAAFEDIETIKDEAALFHLLRYAETSGKYLLLTANASANQLPFSLPDLRSRLMALPAAHIGQPDENLLRVFTAKCFSDRQLRVSEDVVNYVVNHAERSFTAVRDVVERAERMSLENRREITVPLVKKVI